MYTICKYITRLSYVLYKNIQYQVYYNKYTINSYADNNGICKHAKPVIGISPLAI